MDLLTWQAPQPVASFPADQVRAASLSQRISRAVAATLRDCKLDREEVAQRMGEYLGEPVRVPSLDAYASQAREGHRVPACRLMALVHVTGDARLLQLLADEFGLAVIERRYLPLIELAAVREHEDEVRRHAEQLRRKAKSGGLL
jgi:hypothetical protein